MENFSIAGEPAMRRRGFGAVFALMPCRAVLAPRRAQPESWRNAINDGFNLSIRDRVSKTGIARPWRDHSGLTIGIPGVRDPCQVDRLPGMLALPVAGKP